MVCRETPNGSMATSSPLSSIVGQPAEVNTLSRYLLKVVPVLLAEHDQRRLVNFESILHDSEAKLKRFIEDYQEHTLSIIRTLQPDIKEGEGSETNIFTTKYEILLGVHYQTQRYTGVVFIKRSAIIEAGKSIQSQLRIINISESDDSPFETLHAYIQDAVSPLFTSYMIQQPPSEAESEGDQLASTVQKNISELAVNLLHLQQNIAIPEISLSIHPIIQDAVTLASREDRKPTIEDIGNNISDTTFLSALQKQVTNWTTEIRRVTTIQRDVYSGTVLQEVSFWDSMERALYHLRAKRDSPEILLTLEVLKAGKRFGSTISFDSDTGLKDMQEKVLDYRVLMKDFPIKELLTSNSLEAITLAILNIFSHLKKIRNTQYPTDRAVGLVETISRDILTQLVKVLSTHQLMNITFTEFEVVFGASGKVFHTCDEQFDRFESQLRQLSTKKGDHTLKFRNVFNLAHKKLWSRLSQMKSFRLQHEQLQMVMNRVLKLAQQTKKSHTITSTTIEIIEEQLLDKDELLAIKEVHLAYDNVKFVDCLDVSNDGSAAWEAAIERYEERIDWIEAGIAAHLRNQLGSARNAKEMFRIFSCYNPLFVRPHIRAAITEYKTQLIQRVKDDIESLHKKFKMPYGKTPANAMCTMLDIPRISSSIMWARQIEHQLDLCLDKVEAVLGDDWVSHIEGHQLKSDGELFRQKLNPSQLFEEWKKRVDSEVHVVQGRIFSIITQRTKSGPQLRLTVNFNADIISLYKETRYHRSMGFRIPFSISSLAAQANQLYPHAVCLKESIKTYELTCQKVTDNSFVAPLVAGLKIDVQEFIKEGINLTWEGYRLEQFAQKFSECILNFQEKVDAAIHHTEQIGYLVNKLESCEYDHSVFKQILDDVQNLVDYLNLRSYTNLSRWVAELNEVVESRLMKRLLTAINTWKDCLVDQSNDDHFIVDTTMDTSLQVQFKLGGTPQVETIHHKLHMTNQVMYLQPPLELSRCHLITDLHKWISKVTGLQRIQSTRYQIEQEETKPTYRSLLGKPMHKNSQPLVAAYRAIEDLLQEIDSFVKEWLKYQSLWDMEFSNITSKLGEDINLWQKLLLDIMKSQRKFLTADTMRRFGPVEIHYGEVQSEVNLKHDYWYEKIVGQFEPLLDQDTVSKKLVHTTVTSHPQCMFSIVGNTYLLQDQLTKLKERNASLEFNLSAKKCIFDTQLAQCIGLRKELVFLENTVKNLKKQKEDVSVELSCTKKELQQTKENMANQKKDASNVLSAVKTKHAKLVTKLELDIQTVEAAKKELQKDKEYWCSKEMELKEKLASIQQEWTKADKVAMEQRFIHLQDQYDEQQKRIEQLQTDLSTAQDHSETQQIVLKEENHMLQNRVENLTKQKDDVSLELSDTKKALQHVKEDMEKRKKDALYVVETENAKLVAKLELDVQTAEAAKRELQKDKEYLSKSQFSNEMELIEKIASVQQEWSKAEREVTASKVALEKQFIHVQAQYDEQEKRVEKLQTEVAALREEMKLRNRTIGELNERIKYMTNIQLEVSMKEKEECIQSLQLKKQELNEENKRKDEELLIRKAEFDQLKNAFDRITKELQDKEEENLKLAIHTVDIKEQTEKIWKNDFERKRMEFEEKLNQEQHEVNNAAVVRIEQLQSDLKQKEEIIAQYELQLKQKEEAIEQIQYYRNEMERLATLNKQLEVHRSQLQEEIAAVQKSLYHVKYEVSEITENNEELQRDNKELQKVIKELESTADQREKKNEDLQRKLCDIEQEIQVQRQISHDTNVEMKKLRISYVALHSENTSVIEQMKKQNSEKRVLLNHIANLEHQLFQTKLRLNEPLSKLESVTKKLDPLPKEFRHQQQLLWESKEAILNVQRLAEVVQSHGEMSMSTGAYY